MGDIDELIARLAAEGELEGTGGFTLDPAVALAKLREHQLRDPTLFVLCWVRAAVLLGATQIDIEIDADDVYLRFDGEPLSEADFEHLWAAAVGGRGSAHAQACRELALGINGVFCWGAKLVAVRCGSLQVELDRAFTMKRSQLAEPSPRNVIHAKRPLGWELVRRRRLDQRGELPEEQLLVGACAYADAAIVLEGQRLNPDWIEPLAPWSRVDIDDDERRGVLILRAGERSQLHVLKAGVQVATVELPYPHVEAVVDDRLLPLDLSQEKPVEGERWASLLERVAQARWQAWFCAPQLDEAQRRALLHDVLACPDLRWTQVPGATEFAERTRCEAALGNPFGGFRELVAEREPLLQPFPPPANASPSLAEIVDRIRRGEAIFTSASGRWDLPIVPELPVLRFKPPETCSAPHWRPLEQPEHLQEYWRAVHQLRPLRGAAIMQRGWPSLCFTHEALEVRVAWLRGVEGKQGALMVGRAGKLLGEFRLPVDWGPLWADVEGPFVAEPELALDRQLATAVLALLSRYHELMLTVLAQQPTPAEREHLRTYLRGAFGRWSARRLAELEQIPAIERDLAIARWTGAWGVPTDWSSPADEGASADHPLAELAWLEQGERMLCFRDLRAAAERGQFFWIDRDDPLAEEVPAEVWRLDAEERRHIETLLPSALQPFDCHAWSRSDPGDEALPTTLAGAAHSLHFHGHAGEHGLLGLPEHELPPGHFHATRRGARLRVFVGGHTLGCMDVPLPIGPFYGVIELPNARALPHTDCVAKDQTWRAAAAVVEAAALELARTQIAAWKQQCEQPHELARAREWILDLERGAWPQLATELASWTASLPTDHPLRRATSR
jgi:hypothetical protein